MQKSEDRAKNAFSYVDVRKVLKRGENVIPDGGVLENKQVIEVQSVFVFR